jgi:hypothetical protein
MAVLPLWIMKPLFMLHNLSCRSQMHHNEMRDNVAVSPHDPIMTGISPHRDMYGRYCIDLARYMARSADTISHNRTIDPLSKHQSFWDAMICQKTRI